MKLDVVVPTYNRCGLLQKTIGSLLAATVPSGLSVTVWIIDNNSRDETAEVVKQIACGASLPIKYVKETKQGSSSARNAGIAAGNGDLIGFIDDDEEIDASWFEVAAREFSDASIDYIGGACLGNWESPPPAWLPPGYHAVIGVIASKPRAKYGSASAGMLMGGNAIIRRKVFETVGTYATHLGRSGTGLLSDEDAEFYGRLEGTPFQGMYVPDLIIYHYIPTDRLTRRYHRRWAFWRTVSQGVHGREVREPVAYFAGIPRHRIGRALRSLCALPRHALNRQTQGQAFADELSVWDLFGYIYGRYMVNVSSLYKDKH